VNTDAYKQQLVKLEQELVKRVGSEAVTARDTRDDEPGDTGDRANTDEQKSEAFALAETDSDVLTAVRAALGRIEDGTYGQCAVDGGPIEPKRLEALPWTPYCVKHQAEIEAQAPTRTPSR
jgi:DnaK suppressor protein